MLRKLESLTSGLICLVAGCLLFLTHCAFAEGEDIVVPLNSPAAVSNLPRERVASATVRDGRYVIESNSSHFFLSLNKSLVPSPASSAAMRFLVVNAASEGAFKIQLCLEREGKTYLGKTEILPADGKGHVFQLAGKRFQCVDGSDFFIWGENGNAGLSGLRIDFYGDKRMSIALESLRFSAKDPDAASPVGLDWAEVIAKRPWLFSNPKCVAEESRAKLREGKAFLANDENIELDLAGKSIDATKYHILEISGEWEAGSMLSVSFSAPEYLAVMSVADTEKSWHSTKKLSLPSGSDTFLIDLKFISDWGARQYVTGLRLNSHWLQPFKLRSARLLSEPEEQVADSNAWAKLPDIDKAFASLPPRPSSGKNLKTLKFSVFNKSASPLSDALIVIRPRDIPLPADANPSSFGLVDAKGKPLSVQCDDFDGDNLFDQGDEIVFRDTLAPFGAKDYVLNYDCSAVRYCPEASPVKFICRQNEGEVVGRQFRVLFSAVNGDVQLFGAKGAKLLNAKMDYKSDHAYFSLPPLKGFRFVRMLSGPLRTDFVFEGEGGYGAIVRRIIGCHADEVELSLLAIPKKGNGSIGSLGQKFTPLAALNEKPRESRQGMGKFGELYEYAGRKDGIGLSVLNRKSFYSSIGRYLAMSIWSPCTLTEDFPRSSNCRFALHDGSDAAYREAAQKLSAQPLVYAGSIESSSWHRELSELIGRGLEVSKVLPFSSSARKALSDASASVHSDFAASAKAIGGIDWSGELKAVEAALLHDEERVKSKYSDLETAPVCIALEHAIADVVSARKDFENSKMLRGMERLQSAVSGSLYAKSLEAQRLPKRMVASGQPSFQPFFCIGAMGGLLNTQGDTANWWLELGFNRVHWLESKCYEAVTLREISSNKDMQSLLARFDARCIPQFAAKPGTERRLEMLDPKLNGALSPDARDYREGIEGIMRDAGDTPFVDAWVTNNEPTWRAPLSPEGVAAFRVWLSKRHGDVTALNKSWGTSYASFEDIASAPQPSNKGAYYDYVVFRAQCMTGFLGYLNDVVLNSQRDFKNPCARIGVKMIAFHGRAIRKKDPWGIDPWINAPAQRNITMENIYYDDLDGFSLMINECYHAGRGNPVVLTEAGGRAMTMDDRLSHLISFYPIGLNRAFAPLLAAYGVKGISWWNFRAFENFANALEPDDSLPDYSLAITKANREFRCLASLFGSIRQTNNLLYYYPRATFISSDLSYARDYESTASLLERLGYQTRITANEDIADALTSGMPLVVPPCRQIERAAFDSIASFISAGGRALFLGELPSMDEYDRPLPKTGDSAWQRLFGSFSSGPRKDNASVALTSGEIPCDKDEQWHSVNGGERILAYADGSPAAVRRQVGKGSVVWFAGNIGNSFLKYRNRGNLNGKWKFNFADTKPLLRNGALDANDRGLREKWSAPEFNDSNWLTMLVPGTWRDNGYVDITGIGWYRKHFNAGNTKTVLKGGGSFGSGSLFVNGSFVAEMTGAAVEIDITPFCKPGDNVLALRVVGDDRGGGVKDEFSLSLDGADIVSSLPPSSPALVDVLAKMSCVPMSRPSDYGAFSRIVLDAAGKEYLIVVNTHYAGRDFKVAVQAAGRTLDGGLFDLMSGKAIKCVRNGDVYELSLRLEGCDYAVLPLR